MAHYDCKSCEQRDCICPPAPIQAPPPDDGKHWKPGKVKMGFSYCANCEKSFYDHVVRKEVCCPPASIKIEVPSDEELLKMIKSRSLTTTELRSWYEDTWEETTINPDAVLRLIKDVLNGKRS